MSELDVREGSSTPEIITNDVTAAPSPEQGAITDSPPEQAQGVSKEELKQLPEDQRVIVTENTEKRFSELTSTIKAQQAELQQLKQARTVDYQDPGAPKPEDYATDEEYIRADATYQATKNVMGAINQGAQAQALQLQQMELQQKTVAHNQRAQALAEKLPDYEQALQGSFFQGVNQDGSYTVAGQAVLNTENSADIAYYLAKNPNVAIELNNADPVRAGMIVANLSNQLTVTSPNISEAPPPVGAESTGSGTLPPKDETAEKIGFYEIKESNSLRR